MAGVTIYWITRDMRLHDNPALLAAIENSAHVLPVHVFDPETDSPDELSYHSMRFRLESLCDMDASLRILGSRICCLHGSPDQVIPSLVEEVNAKRVVMTECSEAPYLAVVAGVNKCLSAKFGIEIEQVMGHTLWPLKELLRLNGGVAPLTYTHFYRNATRAGVPAPPADAPRTMPPLPDMVEASLRDGNEFAYAIPSLSQLAFVEPTISGVVLSGNRFVGGERVALVRLSEYLSSTERVTEFDKSKTNPLQMNETTQLSPYMSHGCISVRLMHYRISSMHRVKSFKELPTSLVGQLYWREFFYLVASTVPDFESSSKNPICRRIDWERNEAMYSKWKNGTTGFPFIDACMRQIYLQGWTHHLCRHSVATFMSRGDLYLNWEDGAGYFMKYMIDADWSINYGNWIWLSASGFWSDVFRVTNPCTFPRQYDADGEYVRRFIPALRNMPSEFIYEPSKAPEDVQAAAGCIVGKDYPEPMVDHVSASRSCIERLRNAFENAKSAAPSAAAAAKRHRSVPSDELDRPAGEEENDPSMRPAQRQREYHDYWLLSATPEA